MQFRKFKKIISDDAVYPSELGSIDPKYHNVRIEKRQHEVWETINTLNDNVIESIIDHYRDRSCRMELLSFLKNSSIPRDKLNELDWFRSFSTIREDLISLVNLYGYAWREVSSEDKVGYNRSFSDK